jgi:hypothetical protein
MPNLLRGEAVLFANGIPKVGKVTFTTDLNHVLGFAANRDLGFLAVMVRSCAPVVHGLPSMMRTPNIVLLSESSGCATSTNGNH